MSQRNGDRARFQINRKRKLRHRERIRALLTALSQRREAPAATETRGHGPERTTRQTREPHKSIMR